MIITIRVGEVDRKKKHVYCFYVSNGILIRM